MQVMFLKVLRVEKQSKNETQIVNFYFSGGAKILG